VNSHLIRDYESGGMGLEGVVKPAYRNYLRRLILSPRDIVVIPARGWRARNPGFFPPDCDDARPQMTRINKIAMIEFFNPEWRDLSQE